ncbi:uncharacterized protein LOC121693669 [Alosa sapidissima]|uniref:uncharacterized protein LOC121693669 n=1 Tax=Alosa sapidissima TaxID=34773 RepID=UPI001C09FBE2|nr:uncharacterized protein LOC121693669 [Alosa sapidissima]
MGSGKSRGKRVAPASETDADEVNNDSEQAEGNIKSSLEPIRVQAYTNLSLANKKHPDCQSEGQNSEWSTEGELEEILAESNEQKCDLHKDSSVKKQFFSAKTFGLCNYIRVRNDKHVASTHQLPKAGLRSGSCRHALSDMSVKEQQVSNKPVGKTSWASTSQQQDWSDSVTPGTQSKDAVLDAETCDGPSLDKSVILYDATEEDLMKNIEREFS